MKHAAAIRCIRESGHLLEELFSAVASAADKVRRLYDKDVMAGMGDDDFRHMMFFDACFLVQYMLMQAPLDRDRASYLVNMAALEMCTVPSFSASPDEDSAVCSYLLLLGEIFVFWSLLKTFFTKRPMPKRLLKIDHF